MIGNDDITLIEQNKSESKDKLARIFTESNSDLAQSLPNSAEEERKSSSSYEILGSDSNGTPVNLETPIALPKSDAELFAVQFEGEIESELAKIAVKYETQIESYQKKGLNPLTKKLIEKAKQELQKA